MTEEATRRTIAVDFDGTLFKTDYPKILEPIWRVIDAAKREKKNGSVLILWTTRDGKALKEAIAACQAVGLDFDYVNRNSIELMEAWQNDPRKIGADEYWDDRAYNPVTDPNNERWADNG